MLGDVREMGSPERDDCGREKMGRSAGDELPPLGGAGGRGRNAGRKEDKESAPAELRTTGWLCYGLQERLESRVLHSRFRNVEEDMRDVSHPGRLQPQTYLGRSWMQGRNDLPNVKAVRMAKTRQGRIRDLCFSGEVVPGSEG
ncbi:hypothetical protein MLD38_035313 [Melastoma candidum]|uniref:Uncharacterized protein n=1 Tax=Melastoma candidum TaxID=119954 RepID=A0ACB9MG84_9MYRT|nr:hypothetical protein MLD38_035313 [Melastoma candidum]